MIQLVSGRAQLQAYAAVALHRAVRAVEAVVNAQPLVQVGGLHIVCEIIRV
jgi:hypothetical protein